MLSVSRFTLNTRDEEAQLSFSVKQGDTARRIIATLTENGEMFCLPDDCYAVFAASKSDGTKFNDSCVIQDGRIIYDLDPQLTLAVGRADCDITVYGRGGAVISTARFTMTVFESIFAGASDDMVSKDTFHVLNNLIGDANDTINDMEDLNDAVTAAEALRVEAENAREEAETARETAETARETAEDAREAAEKERDAAEDERIAAEDAREAAETARAKAESARAAAEDAREEAEAARVEAEKERVDVNTGIVAQASAAASTAATAASTASTAAQTAATAADVATEAAGSASSDAADAESAAIAAESWTQGGTGTRAGEDTNNAKYWSEQAQAIAGGDYAPRIHTHVVDDITDFPATMPPSAHTHEVDDITDFPTTMPPSAHTHNASDITAGTLDSARLPVVPVDKGGTGATSAAQARANLGAAAASHTHTVGNITDFPATMPPSAHTHNASDINAGTLDSARLPVVPVARGGTGAATAEGARANLGAEGKHTSSTVTLTSSGWSGNLQTVSVSGMAATLDIVVSPAPASQEAWGKAGIYCSAQGAGTLTFTCKSVPTTSLTANILTLRG